MSDLPHDKEVTREVPIAVWEDPRGKGELDEDVLCSLLMGADHSYLVARFLIWADTHMLSEAFFLAAQAAELYLKAFLISRLGNVPTELTRGKRGHDLVLLLERAASAPNSDPLFSDPALREIVRRLSPMAQAGRYPRTGYRGPAGDMAAFLDWLDDFAYRVRALVPYAQNCRDDVQLLREFKAPAIAGLEYEQIGRSALRELFFFQNRAFQGWWATESGRRVKLDGSPW